MLHSLAQIAGLVQSIVLLVAVVTVRDIRKDTFKVFALCSLAIILANLK